MGITTQELNSLPLSSTYQSYYKEFQVRNWTPVSIVVTESNGEQFWLPPEKNARESEATIDVESRKHNGMRSQQTEFGMKDVPIKGAKTTIPFGSIKSKPLRLPEYNIILSTFDQAAVAKAMLHESMLNPVLYETRVDMEIVDPRLVFQVIDPGNQWSELYVNVFGQTIVVRAGHYTDDFPFEKAESDVHTRDAGTLICYLRYPHQYYNGAPAVTTVFEVSLECVPRGEPITLPSGDVICVAPTMEGMQILLAKKQAGFAGRAPASCLSDKMVSKDMFDLAKKNFDDEIERLKETHRIEIDTLKTQRANDVARLTQENLELKRKIKTQEDTLHEWENLSSFRNKVDTDQESVREAEARARKEEAEAARKEIERMHTTLKVAGAVAAAAMTFITTMVVKSKKK